MREEFARVDTKEGPLEDLLGASEDAPAFVFRLLNHQWHRPAMLDDLS